MQASFPLHAQALEKSRKTSPAHSGLHACAHQVPPTGSALPPPLPTNSHPSRPLASPAPLRILAALSDALLSCGSWRKSLLTAKQGMCFLFALIQSPFNTQGCCSLHSPLSCMINFPCSSCSSAHKHAAILPPGGMGNVQNNLLIPLQLHPFALCLLFNKTKQFERHLPILLFLMPPLPNSLSPWALPPVVWGVTTWLNLMVSSQWPQLSSISLS